MPYETYQSGGKWCVRNKDTGDPKGCFETKHDAVVKLRMMYMIEGGKEPTGKKGKPFRIRS